MFGASVAGIMNSTARSDEEARNRVVWFFGSILAVLFFFDIGCALVTLWISCKFGGCNDYESDESISHCLRSSIQKGFSFHPVSKLNNVTGQDSFGDLFLLAILRCLMTLLLLKLGARYGQSPKPTSSNNDNAGSQEESEPTQSPLEEPLLANEEVTNEENQEQDQRPQNHRCIACCGNGNDKSWALSPPRAKNAVLICLFLASAFYQVYAGLKVSTATCTANSSQSTLLTLLLCLTVLWINGQTFVFRTLLEEMTRENGLFLPPEVHRHPMYFQDDRGLAMHWCDLCRKRISSGCYRCSLCDFDVCVACARRNDAAVVGENVLRGDRGVRVETSLSTTGYFKRSLKVAKNELPLLILSFCLLATSSVSRLLLPHFQGHIIDKVIPQDDGSYDKSGFLRFIKIYIWLMVIQGAISTIYSAIFTLVSRRLKFTIRNALLEKILAQDVAYFDGTESGRLISCLTNDLDLMMVSD